MKISKIEQGVVKYELELWEEFLPLITDKLSNSPALIFRGQANSDWKVESTLDRLERRFPTRTTRINGKPVRFDCTPAGRDTHLRSFEETARGKRGINPPSLNENEWWALAQHHGLATPMLDWTYSPFVALFFAFECERCRDTSGEWVEPEYRAVFAVSSSYIAEKKGNAPRAFSPKGETGHRLINQAGLFLRMPPKADLEGYVRKYFHGETEPEDPHPRAILLKIIIPGSDRLGCLKLLNKMNINRMSLFPDLDGAAQYVNSLWEIGFDTSIGYIADHLA